MRFSNSTVRRCRARHHAAGADVLPQRLQMAFKPDSDDSHIAALADRGLASVTQSVHRLRDPASARACRANAGDTMIAIAASTPMIATTTSTSSRVKPDSSRRLLRYFSCMAVTATLRLAKSSSVRQKSK